MELGLQSGQACYLWKKDASSDTRREAVAWLTTEKNLSKKVVQISKTFQEVCSFKLADDLIIAAAGNVNIAELIILRDVTEGAEHVPELRGEDKPHWEWYLRENLGKLSCFLLSSQISSQAGYQLFEIFHRSRYGWMGGPSTCSLLPSS